MALAAPFLFELFSRLDIEILRREISSGRMLTKKLILIQPVIPPDLAIEIRFSTQRTRNFNRLECTHFPM